MTDAPDLAPLEALSRELQRDPLEERLCFAAAHVAVDASYAAVGHTEERPGSADELAGFIDWEATRAIRRALDGHGFGIAEAMDTAQRFELGWRGARRLIEECGRLRLRRPWVAGAGSDQLDQVESLDRLVGAVVEQVDLISDCGGWAVLLPQQWLVGRGEEATVAFYRGVVERVAGPLIVHWLGEMFAPSLAGYFPGDSFHRVMTLDPSKVRGAKISLLDARREVEIRRQLLERDQVLFTGDDWHFPELIAGHAPATGQTAIGELSIGIGDFSHALLGILGPVARPASLALRLLAAGRLQEYRRLMAPCAEMGRLIFEEPTRHYKAGVAFVAWLDGLQDNPLLLNHVERQRSRAHYRQLFATALRAGAFGDPEAAWERMASLDAHLAAAGA